MAFIDNFKKYVNSYFEERNKIKDANLELRFIVYSYIKAALIGLFFSFPLIGFPVNLMILGINHIGVKLLCVAILALFFMVCKWAYYDLICTNEKLININKKVLKKFFTLSEIVCLFMLLVSL